MLGRNPWPSLPALHPCRLVHPGPLLLLPDLHCSLQPAHLPHCRGNATITLAHTLASYPGALDLACVQFPDPHFKARHK